MLSRFENLRIMDEVLAILVLYKTRLEESASFQSLTSALSSSGEKLSILIYDNSPEPLTDLRSAGDVWSVTYVHDATNPGISKAYNRGVEEAKQLNKRWLLLLDQDTTFPIECISVYSKFLSEKRQMTIACPILNDHNKIISPYRSWFGHGRMLRNIKPGLQQLTAYKAINSGMMVSLKLIEKCGGYNENIHIDFSDLAFLLTAQQHSAELEVLDLKCKHQFFHLHKNSTVERLERFKSYCHDLNGIHSQTGKWMYKLFGFFRALKLSVLHRQVGYLNRFYLICVK